MADLFEGNEPPITPGDMVAELNREIVMRLKVYPHLVAVGKMKEGEAKRRIAVIRSAMNFIIERAKD